MKLRSGYGYGLTCPPGCVHPSKHLCNCKSLVESVVKVWFRLLQYSEIHNKKPGMKCQYLIYLLGSKGALCSLCTKSCSWSLLIVNTSSCFVEISNLDYAELMGCRLLKKMRKRQIRYMRRVKKNL